MKTKEKEEEGGQLIFLQKVEKIQSKDYATSPIAPKKQGSKRGGVGGGRSSQNRGGKRKKLEPKNGIKNTYKKCKGLNCRTN